MSTSDLRVRRPRDKDVLLQALRDEGGFPTMRDALLFAAAVGFEHGQFEPFESTSEPIRYEILIDPAFADTLVLMIAASSSPEDPEIVGQNRLADALKIFEGYANGGLSFIQGEINASRETAESICLRLATQALAKDVASRPRIDALAEELSWG